jgi:putative oxidoreductase
LPAPLAGCCQEVICVHHRLRRYAPYVLSILRIVAALLFIAHGTGKYFDFPAMGGNGRVWGFPDPVSLQGVAGIIEIVGGILVALGLFTRQAAFIMSGEMAVAYFTAHFPHSFFPTQNGGESAILFCFFFLYLVFEGPGLWSLDARRGKA